METIISRYSPTVLAPFLDCADKGERVTLRDGAATYVIYAISEASQAPIEGEVTPELAKRIAQAEENVAAGRCVSLRSPNEIDAFLSALRD